MVLALFNGSYIGKRNTGIGVVSKNLISALPCELVTALDPVNSGRDGSIEIPSDLSPENGLRGHSKRLYWLEKNIPNCTATAPDPPRPLLGVRVAHNSVVGMGSRSGFCDCRGCAIQNSLTTAKTNT